MTIPDNYIPVKEIGDGSTVEFSGSWKILAEEYLIVYLQNITTGEFTLQTLGDYTVTFTDSNFIVTFNTAPSSDYYVVIGRNTARTQGFGFKTATGFSGDQEEKSFDKLTAMVQELKEQVNRSVLLQLGSSVSNLILNPENSALIGWNAAGTALENYTAADIDLTLVSTFIAGFLDDVDDITARSTLGAAASATTISGGGLVTGGGDLSANRTLTVAAATQAEQEAASSVAVAVTPGRQHYHPSAAKAWVRFPAGAASIASSYNVSSLTDTGTGDALVNLANGLGTVGAVEVSFTTPAIDTAYGLDYVIVSGSIIQVRCQNTDANTPADASMSVTIFGDFS